MVIVLNMLHAKIEHLVVLQCCYRGVTRVSQDQTEHNVSQCQYHVSAVLAWCSNLFLKGLVQCEWNINAWGHVNDLCERMTVMML
jgi:hypothetical protein